MLAVQRSSSKFSFFKHSSPYPGLQSFGDFRDGQDAIALKVLGVLAHPVFLILLQFLLFDVPETGVAGVPFFFL